MTSLRKRLRLRYSVRTLIAATTILGALLGLAGNEVQRIRLHRQAARKVQELGGRCGFVTGGSFKEGWGPAWFPVVCNGTYADYQYVWFNSTSNMGLRDVDLAVLKDFPSLKVVEMAAPLITDEGMAHLQGIKSLRELQLYESQVTSRGLRQLRGIPLEKLALCGRQITDETLEELETFPGLRKLIIAGTRVTEAGVSHFKHVPLLEKLILNDSPIGDPAMDQLARLTRLYEVNLIELPITDAGISRLAGLESLRHLEVVKTQVTDQGLLSFRNTRALKHMGIDPQPAPETLKALASALPGCDVYVASGFRCMQGW